MVFYFVIDSGNILSFTMLYLRNYRKMKPSDEDVQR